MPPKKKDDRSKVETVDQIELHKYCSKEIFDVLFLNEVDETSKKTLDEIIEIARTYEYISYLTFITYDDVMGFLKNYKSAFLPPSIKPVLEEVCTKIEALIAAEQGLPTQLFAQLMKLKLIEVMYYHYSKEVTVMLKRKKLEEDLNILTKECKKGDAGKGGKGGKGSKSGVGSKSGKSTTSSVDKKKKGGGAAPVIEDYTTIPIETESDIIFDDDIFNHVWFYVFEGFYDPDLLYELYNLNVPITAVIKVTAHPEDESTISSESQKNFYDGYWDSVFKYFDGPRRLAQLENTILMRFSTYGDDFKESFQQLLWVIKNISDIKLQHLNYLRHINIYEVKETYNYIPLECLNVYNRLMDKLPLELANETVLLNSLLDEVCIRVEDSKSNPSLLENFSHQSVRFLKSHSEINCVDPCRIQAFFKHRQRINPDQIISKKPSQSFLTHECDELNIVLHSYKKYGPLVMDLVMKLLKSQKAIDILNRYPTDYTEIIHKHDADPSTKTVPDDEEIFMHIFYLMFFSTFDCKRVLADFEDTELTANLQTYHKVDFVESAQTSVHEVIHSDEEIGHEEEIKSYEDVSEAGECADTYDINVLKEYIENNAELKEDIDMYHEEYQDEEEIYFPSEWDRNYYNKSALQYFWKENMKPDVLLQEIFKAQKEYLYMEQKYSPETDNLLLKYSDCLDEFGINTKIYEESLITPICLRDFCRYITVEKAEWLDKHKPPKYFRKCEDIEVCKGVIRINQLHMFQEYSHLLDTALKIENVQEKQPSIEDSVTFEQLLNELKNYPPNTGIMDECKQSQYKANFLAYDLGTKYFQFKGAKTTFHSHDHVKITVDSTRFLDEDPNKCTVKLCSEGNTLVLHSNKFYLKEDYTFHMNLVDGTIITYILPNPSLRKYTRRASDEDPPEFADYTPPKTEKVEETEIVAEPVEEMKILSVDGDHFRNLEHSNQDETLINTAQFKENEALFDSLKQAASLNCPVYKVSNNLTYLKKLKPEVGIPVSNILRRVLHKTIQKRSFRSLTKRYLPRKQKPSRHRHFDARIALPNGLYISFYPSLTECRKNRLFDVKQEFLTKKIENSLIEHEEFRLFTREGCVLVKHIDGTIRILKTNGDIIDYEKLDVESETVKQWHLKPCHCKNVNDYRKKLNRIMKRNEDTTASFVSRRAQFHTKKGYVVKPELVDILKTSQVPYLKHVLTKFNGNRICLEDGKVTQKRILHITDEHDYFAQEIYYERSDGFTSYFDRYGKQQVKFADGTKISSIIHVAKQLVDGYVYISLNFVYEHPNYATVVYNHNNALKVVLKNAVFRRDVDNKMSVKIGQEIQTIATKDHLVFQRTCAKCSSKFRCSFGIDPFTDRRLDPSATFFYAKDSYNKRFCSDYGGNCKRNADYLRGPFNVFNCNHYKRMSYNKMFVVNKNLSGFMLWTDNMVATKKKMGQNEDVMMKEQEDVNNAKIKVMKIRRKFFDEYSNRFLNTNLLKEQMCLAKYKRKEVKHLVYTTSRVVKKMTDFEGIQKCLSEVMVYFQKYGAGTRLLEILEKLLRERDVNPDDDLSTKRVTEIIKEPSICLCVKDKVDIRGKIARWQEECSKYRGLIRNNVINPYFTSQFCQVIECDDSCAINQE